MKVIIEEEMREEESKTKKKPKISTKRIVTHRIFYQLEVKVIKIEVTKTFKEFY